MSESGVSANRLELLQIADAVARDKSIDKSIVISAMEDAIQKAAKTRYGSENEIKAEIDPKTGQEKNESWQKAGGNSPLAADGVGGLERGRDGPRRTK